jgi:hypothetical protein
MHLLTDSYAWHFIRLDPLSSKRHFAFQANNASLLRYLIFSHFLYSLSQLQSSNTLASIPIPRLYNRLLEVNSLLASETHDTSTKGASDLPYELGQFLVVTTGPILSYEDFSASVYSIPGIHSLR